MKSSANVANGVKKEPFLFFYRFYRRSVGSLNLFIFSVVKPLASRSLKTTSRRRVCGFIVPPAGGDVHRRAGGGVLSSDPVGVAATLQRPQDRPRQQDGHQRLPVGRVLYGYAGPTHLAPPSTLCSALTPSFSPQESPRLPSSTSSRPSSARTTSRCSPTPPLTTSCAS